MRGLLSISFGTSHEDTRVRTIDAIEADLRAMFPELTFYSAWTSGRIIQKVKAERGEHHDTLEEAFARLTADGVDDLIVSTMCLMQGLETAKLRKAIDEWATSGRELVHVARPLLTTSGDRKAVARVICEEFSGIDDGDALLLMGHGSSSNELEGADVSGPNRVYTQIQDELHALGRPKFFVATVEGEPTFEDVLPLLQASGAQRVFLAPLMIVAGDHAKNDLAGDGADSWASKLAARGFKTEAVLKGLGEYLGIRQLVCEHVQDALAVREVGLRG